MLAEISLTKEDCGLETTFTLWFLIIGALFMLMALTGTTLQRLPLTTAIIYLVVGFVLGASVLGVLPVDPIADAALLERVTEIAVLISLFTAGLKLRTPLHEGRWILPLRLAFGAMTLTVGMIALAGVFLLHLPWGAALLLGAILAPTDPVLASDVQVANPGDQSIPQSRRLCRHDKSKYGVASSMTIQMIMMRRAVLRGAVGL